jgi:hypothetical protein
MQTDKDERLAQQLTNHSKTIRGLSLSFRQKDANKIYHFRRGQRYEKNGNLALIFWQRYRWFALVHTHVVQF